MLILCRCWCGCQAFNLSDPSGFFEDISAVPTLANRTIISVHVYGPNITVCTLSKPLLKPSKVALSKLSAIAAPLVEFGAALYNCPAAIFARWMLASS